MKKSPVEAYSWVVRGKQRRDIINHIGDRETPTQISQKSGYSLNHTSRVLNEFKRKGIARILNPKQKTGRIYELTGKGKIIRDEIRKKAQK
ncbi:hypothetical protein J4475_01425 [Candidatus Woesearchaeota archaeon]|nr:hypothetical protein [Candidatus Woesearchaeota archaeon]